MEAKQVWSLLSYALILAFLAMPRSVIDAQSVPETQVKEESPEAKASFSVIRIKLSPDSEADDWGIGVRGRNLWAVHVTTEELIQWAYGINSRQIEHAPGWLATEHFDFDGLPDAGVKPSSEQYRTMLQAALAERFALKFHPSQKSLPVYVLSIAEGGLKIPKSVDQGSKSSWGAHRGWLSIQCMTFGDVARLMQRTIFDRPVLDQTGLGDRYTFILKWRADETQFAQMRDVPEETGTEDVEDIYTAVRQQLGLKIESKKALVPTLEIESVSRPSAN